MEAAPQQRGGQTHESVTNELVAGRIGTVDDGRMGAPVGNYRVVVNNQVTPMMGEYPPAPAASPQARLALPAEHGDMQRTRLRATVPDGGGRLTNERFGNSVAILMHTSISRLNSG